jgi:HSP20 family protein
MDRVQEPGYGRCAMLKKNPLSLAKTEPASALSPFEEFERRFEDFFRRPFSLMEAPWMRWPAFAGEVSPAMDIYEEGGDVVVKAEIPGMRKEEIHIDINEKTVTISGEKKKEEKVERKNYVHLERSYGSFARTFALPAEVQTEKARATFRDGVLEIRVPKTAEAASRTRKVAIE